MRTVVTVLISGLLVTAMCRAETPVPVLAKLTATLADKWNDSTQAGKCLDALDLLTKAGFQNPEKVEADATKNLALTDAAAGISLLDLTKALATASHVTVDKKQSAVVDTYFAYAGAILKAKIAANQPNIYQNVVKIAADNPLGALAVLLRISVGTVSPYSAQIDMSAQTAASAAKVEDDKDLIALTDLMASSLDSAAIRQAKGLSEAAARANAAAQNASTASASFNKNLDKKELLRICYGLDSDRLFKLVTGYFPTASSN
jgi:hypothetical protein